MRILSLLLIFIFSSSHSMAGSAVTETVGQVSDTVITSREVQISGFIEKLLYPLKNKTEGVSGPVKLELVAVDSAEFRNLLTSVLLESVVAFEAESFGFANASEKEVQDSINKVEKNFSEKIVWIQLEVSGQELSKIIKRKLVAKNFLKFKTSSMASIVTDSEVEAYYGKNKAKFGSMPFASFKDNIKAFLEQQQLEDRLRSWFEIIKRKYKVRNYISG